MKLTLHPVLILLAALLPTLLSAESLWNKSGKSGRSVGLFSDLRARGVGDIVTIVVQESATINAEKSSSTNKSSDLQEAITQILGMSGGDLPTSDWDSSSGFQGGGSLSDTQTAQSQLSVMVVDKLPNGNLAIEGMRQVTMANEINFAVIRGFIRPVDIRDDNTILSSRIADAKVEFIASGELTESQRKGWLNRAQSFASPF